MEDFNNEEKHLPSVEEQIAQIEREMRGENTVPEPEQPQQSEQQVEQEQTYESCEVKPKKCNCGMCVGLSGIILGLAAIILFVLMFTGVINPKNASNEEPKVEETIFDKPVTDAEAQDIAYIDLDTLLLTYNYAIKLQEDLAMEQKKAEGTIQSRMKKFESMYNAYMEKARTGMFLSAASQQAQQSELEKEQAAIENLQATLTNQLLEKQTAMNQEIYDSVINFVNIYADGRFKVVLGNMGGVTVVYSQPGMNITADVVAKLNQRYGGILENDTKTE
ncbi:MAG: OmpH family outer membrane protein [Bacteroidales bacterium]|nr:OmpH family outer membrane protein [Bacteroidales bacterium]